MAYPALKSGGTIWFMDLSAYSKCPSYRDLVTCHEAYLRAFAIKAQDMPTMFSRFDKMLKHCDCELDYINGKAKQAPTPPELDWKPEIEDPYEAEDEAPEPVQAQKKAQKPTFGVSAKKIPNRFELAAQARKSATPKELPNGFKQVLKPRPEPPIPPASKPESKPPKPKLPSGKKKK